MAHQGEHTLLGCGCTCTAKHAFKVHSSFEISLCCGCKAAQTIGPSLSHHHSIWAVCMLRLLTQQVTNQPAAAAASFMASRPHNVLHGMHDTPADSSRKPQCQAQSQVSKQSCTVPTGPKFNAVPSTYDMRAIYAHLWQASQPICTLALSHSALCACSMLKGCRSRVHTKKHATLLCHS